MNSISYLRLKKIIMVYCSIKLQLKKIVAPSILILFLQSVNASTFYVSTAGSDKNNGSINFPWRTVMHAWENSGGGDTVFVRQGTYTEHEMWLHVNTQSNGIEHQMWTLSSFPGEKARFTNAKIVIDDNYVRIRGLLLDGDKSSGCSYMSVRCTEGIREHVEILDNIFTGTQTIPVLFLIADSSIVQGNTVNITNGSTSHGIYIMHGNQNIIRNNYITGMKKYGIHVYDENKYGHYTAIKNYIIENNVVVGSKSSSGIIIGSGSANGIIPIDGVVVRNNLIINNSESGIYVYKKGANKNIEIYNNTIYGNGGDGIYIPSGSNTRDVLIKNNIFAQNGFNIRLDNVDNLIVSHNLYYQPSSVGNGVIDAAPIYKDPLFINADNGDFHLKKNSPAIDAGVDVGIVYNDNAPDLGAFEYVQSSTSVNVTSLRAYLKDEGIELKWQIPSINNNFGFEIERGIDGRNYQKIGFVKGYGATSMVQTYKFLDKKVKQGHYSYRLKLLDLNGKFEYSSTVEITVSIPDQFNLQQNYPNPFKHSTQICYNLPLLSKSMYPYLVSQDEVSCILVRKAVGWIENCKVEW